MKFQRKQIALDIRLTSADLFDNPNFDIDFVQLYTMQIQHELLLGYLSYKIAKNTNCVQITALTHQIDRLFLNPQLISL